MKVKYTEVESRTTRVKYEFQTLVISFIGFNPHECYNKMRTKYSLNNYLYLYFHLWRPPDINPRDEYMWSNLTRSAVSEIHRPARLTSHVLTLSLDFNKLNEWTKAELEADPVKWPRIVRIPMYNLKTNQNTVYTVNSVSTGPKAEAQSVTVFCCPVTSSMRLFLITEHYRPLNEAFSSTSTHWTCTVYLLFVQWSLNRQALLSFLIPPHFFNLVPVD